MTSKKYLFAFARMLGAFFLLLPAMSVFAQDGSRLLSMSPEEIAQTQTLQMKERLALSEEQEEDIYDINFKYAGEMKAILAGGRSMGAMQKMQSMSARKDKEIKAVLEKKQYKQYLRLREEMRQSMRGRM